MAKSRTKVAPATVAHADQKTKLPAAKLAAVVTPIPLAVQPEDDSDSNSEDAGPNEDEGDDDDDAIPLDQVEFMDDDAVPQQKLEIDNKVRGFYFYFGTFVQCSMLTGRSRTHP